MNTWTEEKLIELFAKAFHEVMPDILEPINKRLDKIEKRLDIMEKKNDKYYLKVGDQDIRIDILEEKAENVIRN